MGKNPMIAKIDSVLASKGITKKEFYSACDITSSSYSQWNTGKTTPSMESIKRVADYLNVSFSYLLELYENGCSYIYEPEQKEKSSTPEGAELIPGYEDLSEENKAKARDFIAFLLSQQ